MKMIDTMINPQMFIIKAFTVRLTFNVERIPHVIPVKSAPMEGRKAVLLKPNKTNLPMAISDAEIMAGINPPKAAAITMAKCRKSAYMSGLTSIENDINTLPRIPKQIPQ
jgi:hypothetical protein